MQMLCMRNRATAEGYNHSREPKNSGIDQQLTTDSAKIVATVCVQAYGKYPLISTPHPIPDVAQLLNLPLPTHELCSHPYLKSLCNNYNKQDPSNADPPPAKPTQATAQGPKYRKATAGRYELDQRYPTSSNSAESSKQHKTGSEHLPQQARMEPDAYANRIHKGDVFVHLTRLKQTSESYIQTKRLNKRSPTIPLLLQSELSIVGN
ncbi:hypothetical protein F511_17505 [Dorcoceras hygrometricum]|uniref:Uncharacterized protein n=1 Tax=Dorcoceras hygrometricum TaxID=472368 RepID=A0A2Z7AZU3_9LAMI|nr:hypothetical protein F511_17505 [Dorcoceras hygrometricum]